MVELLVCIALVAYIAVGLFLVGFVDSESVFVSFLVLTVWPAFLLMAAGRVVGQKFGGTES